MTTKKEIKARLAAVLQEWHDEIAQAIRDRKTDSYETISRDYGTSLMFTFGIAKRYGIRREADKPVAQEVVNG